MSLFFGWMGNRQTHGHLAPIVDCQHTIPGLKTIVMENSLFGCQHPELTQRQKQHDMILLLGQITIKNKPNLHTESEKLDWILQQYLRQGPQVVHQLEGQFLLLIARAKMGEVFIATDKLATMPLYYSKTDEGLFFTTDLSVFQKHLQLNKHLSANAIYHYLYYHNIPSPLCIYDNFSRLIPGHYLIYHNDHVKTLNYWQPHYSQFKNRTFQEKKSLLHQTLKHSTESALQYGKSGVFLSGGIDSTSLLALATELNHEPIDAFTIGFDVDNFDEVYFAKLAANTYRAKHHVYYLQPKDIIACFESIQTNLSQPFGNASIIPTWYCAKLAKEHGIETLLGGDGGDELFGGNTRYAKQQLFQYYHYLPKYLRKVLLEPLFSKTRFYHRYRLFSKAASYIDQANTPMPQRMESYNLLQRMGMDNILDPHMTNQINSHAPMQLLTYYFNQIDAKSILGKMLGTDLKFTLTDNDLVKVTQACHCHSIDVRFPFLSDEMIDFSLSLPDKDKVHGQQLRSFYKKAMKSYIPKEIISKSKHGFGMPFGIWLCQDKPLKEFTFDHLQSLKKRTIIKPSFIDSLCTELLHNHPSYYGVLCWVFFMLEGWLQAHENPTKGIQFRLQQESTLPVTI